LGNWAEVETVGRILGRDHFRRVLLEAPPGVFDIRSWHYWHLVFDLPVPPLPERKL
jgi:hypothetical protein